MRSLSVISLLFSTLLAGCDATGPTVVGAERDLLASETRIAPMLPFETSSYSFQVIGGSPDAGCNDAGEVRLFLVGEGTATQLGRFTVTFSFCSRADLTLADGQGAFEAANGDLLYFVFDGASTIISPTLRRFTSFAAFAGGTGRFDGAGGQAVVTGTINSVTRVGSGRWAGSISVHD